MAIVSPWFSKQPLDFLVKRIKRLLRPTLVAETLGHPARFLISWKHVWWHRPSKFFSWCGPPLLHTLTRMSCHTAAEKQERVGTSQLTLSTALSGSPPFPSEALRPLLVDVVTAASIFLLQPGHRASGSSTEAPSRSGFRGDGGVARGIQGLLGLV